MSPLRSVHLAFFLPLFLFTCLLLHPLFEPKQSAAESLSVSLQVGSTKLTFSGTTNSNTFVTIKEGDTTISTTTSDATGAFSTTFIVALPDTIHNYVLSTSYRSLSYSLNVVGNTETVIANIDLIYLSPSPSTSPTTSSSSSPSPSPSDNVMPSPSPSFDPTLLYSGTPSSPAPPFLYNLDPNQDGKLSLGELVIVVTSWFTNKTACDLNRDHNCNLSDLSILLYYIER